MKPAAVALLLLVAAPGCSAPGTDDKAAAAATEGAEMKRMVALFPDDIRSGIDHYQELLQRSDVFQALNELRRLVPELEEFVVRNPGSVEGNIELATAYVVRMHLATTYYTPGPELQGELLEFNEKDYVTKALTALDRFDANVDRQDPRREAASQMRDRLADLQRAIRGRLMRE